MRSNFLVILEGGTQDESHCQFRCPRQIRLLLGSRERNSHAGRRHRGIDPELEDAVELRYLNDRCVRDSGRGNKDFCGLRILASHACLRTGGAAVLHHQDQRIIRR